MSRRPLTAALAVLAAVAGAAALAVPAALAAPATAAAGAKARTFVLYAKPTRAQFVNHADDRERGDIQSPFESDVLPTPPSANSSKKGARAGDKALFSFKIYSDLNLTRFVGNAIYLCVVNFAQEATCEATFELSGGTMTASGPAGLDTSRWILPVIGGTGRYGGAHGQLSSAPSGSKKNAQILRFQLV